MLTPTEDQIEKCAWLGWEYLGDCIFSSGDLIGWFDITGFVKS